MISIHFRALARAAGVCTVLATALAVFGSRSLGAQSEPDLGAFVPAPASKNAPAPTVKSVSHHRTSPAKAVAPDPTPDPPPAPPVPETPKWPLNDVPAPPSIHWDSHGLHVEAPNSSLRQILDEVATATGVKVEGLGPDERVFGDYGPGPAREIISQILHGSTYNVLMLGDQGEGTPREIILSQRSAVSAQSGQANRPAPQEDDSDQVTAPEPEEPNRQPMVPAINQPVNQPNQPGGAPMTPQQRMLEMQRQQMLMMQQQQQNQPVQTQPPQPQQ